MSGPDNSGTTPTPAVDYTTSGSTFPSVIDTFTAVNGANALGENQGRDITWSVTAFDSNNNNFSSSFAVAVSQTNELSTCILRNVTTSSIPVGTYTINLKCLDGGGAFDEIVITAQLGVIPSSVYDITWTYNLGSDNSGNLVTKRATAIEVDMVDNPLNYNGWYIVAGSWSSISSGVNVITMKQQNECEEPLYFYSNATIGDVISNWKACTTNDNPSYQNTSVPIPSSEFLQVGFEVIQ
jgi:hypothetical protein